MRVILYRIENFLCKTFIDRIQANQMKMSLKRLVNTEELYLKDWLCVCDFLSMNYVNQNQRIKMLERFCFRKFSLLSSCLEFSKEWFWVGNKMNALFIALGKYFVIYMTHSEQKLAEQPIRFIMSSFSFCQCNVVMAETRAQKWVRIFFFQLCSSIVIA